MLRKSTGLTEGFIYAIIVIISDSMMVERYVSTYNILYLKL